ncbi:MAG TPA: hypothetical protein VF008_09740 [Niastella sp.]
MAIRSQNYNSPIYIQNNYNTGNYAFLLRFTAGYNKMFEGFPDALKTEIIKLLEPVHFDRILHNFKGINL